MESRSARSDMRPFDESYRYQQREMSERMDSYDDGPEPKRRSDDAFVAPASNSYR